MSRGLLSVRDVGFGFPVAFALLIELVSAFGPVGIARYASATRDYARRADVAPPASPATLVPAVAHLEHDQVGSVVDFVAGETVPASEAAAIGGAELHSEYVRWCGQKVRAPLGPEAFVAEFDRLRELPALNGNVRLYFRRAVGQPKIRLRAAPGTAEFALEYRYVERGNALA